RGKSPLEQIRGGLWLLLALGQALRLVWRLQPDCVLGLGGYAAGPGGVASWLLRRPLVIHEQNAAPGPSNRLLDRLARRVLLGFPIAWPTAGGHCVGNPVRLAIATLAPPDQRWQRRQPGPLRLLVLGGSQGAGPINELMRAVVEGDLLTEPVAIHHQTGQGDR